MIKKFIKNILLSLTVIFLLMAIFFLIEHIFVKPQDESGAFLGLLMIASIFGIPYLIFFKLNSKKPNDSDYKENRQKLVSKRCTYCNSTQIITIHDGFQCEHCGSKYG